MHFLVSLFLVLLSTSLKRSKFNITCRAQYDEILCISIVSNARITPHTLSFVKKLVSTFGIGFEPASSVSTTLSTAASESLARRAQATAQDPVFQRLKEQFATDFDFRFVEN